MLCGVLNLPRTFFVADMITRERKGALRLSGMKAIYATPRL
jgi:hypothetical protein